MRLGIIADDNTGASDAAGMLTEKGVPTALVFDLNALRSHTKASAEFDALVIGTQTRSIPPREAYQRTGEALHALRQLGVEKFQLKYCSTFDSTKEGNIGPSLDAILDALDVAATIVCPALPVNGRTVYQGHLFVHGQLLSESALRHHPLNPMTDSNLVRWLGYQTKRQVVSVPLSIVRSGATRLKQHLDDLTKTGITYLVVDAIEQTDLDIIAQATTDWPFVSGGSGLTASLPNSMFSRREPLSFDHKLNNLRAGVLVVSGSQSPATNKQNEHALAHGFSAVAVDARAIVDGSFLIKQTAATAEALLRQGRRVLIYSKHEGADHVQKVQALGQAKGLSAAQTGGMIAEALAKVVERLVSQDLVGRLVVSGGETSGAVCQALAFNIFEAGLPIDPGVPYCFPLSHPGMMVALKSGNFGAEDFYTRAINPLRST